MNEPKRSSFIPKWARDGKWELADDFPPIGVPEEPQESEPTMTDDNPLAKWIAEQRADREAFKAKVDAELRRMDRESRLQWLMVGIAYFGVGLLAVLVGASR